MHSIRATFGNTKYCDNYLNQKKCTIKDCLYVHSNNSKEVIVEREDLNKVSYKELRYKAAKLANIYSSEMKKKLLGAKPVEKYVLPGVSTIYTKHPIVEEGGCENNNNKVTTNNSNNYCNGNSININGGASALNTLNAKMKNEKNHDKKLSFNGLKDLLGLGSIPNISNKPDIENLHSENEENINIKKKEKIPEKEEMKENKEEIEKLQVIERLEKKMNYDSNKDEDLEVDLETKVDTEPTITKTKGSLEDISNSSEDHNDGSYSVIGILTDVVENVISEKDIEYNLKHCANSLSNFNDAFNLTDNQHHNKELGKVKDESKAPATRVFKRNSRSSSFIPKLYLDEDKSEHIPDLILKIVKNKQKNNSQINKYSKICKVLRKELLNFSAEGYSDPTEKEWARHIIQNSNDNL